MRVCFHGGVFEWAGVFLSRPTSCLYAVTIGQRIFGIFTIRTAVAFYCCATMALAGIKPVALAETMLPATPGPSPATYIPLIFVSRLPVVSS